jgi:hypothetical protein
MVLTDIVFRTSGYSARLDTIRDVYQVLLARSLMLELL